MDVPEVLAAAHNEALGVDQAVPKGLSAAEEPVMSEDAKQSYGPLTTGLDLSVDLDLVDRERAFKQLAISPQENERFARCVREAMPGHEREANLLLTHKQWLLIAARMAQMESEGKPVRQHLARLATDMSWQEEKGTILGPRLV
ncbi:hypothetical protein ACIBJF_46205 [Streptomyces sp. NPDC050743]|uniref:hypothetical protein n=1 Tax=Streptomyces sp. NPDC050743 TaxID=3365634 RepID=UPI0037ABC08F